MGWVRVPSRAGGEVHAAVANDDLLSGRRYAEDGEDNLRPAKDVGAVIRQVYGEVPNQRVVRAYEVEQLCRCQCLRQRKCNAE
jgi:hypothetical protein